LFFILFPFLFLFVDLCKLTNLPAAGLLCEIVKPDDPLGSMARRDDCKAFAQQWGFKMISIDQLQVYMEKQKKEGRV
jgi:3,4-dihydroxy 2-butanone 4-phosphate synthase